MFAYWTTMKVCQWLSEGHYKLQTQRSLGVVEVLPCKVKWNALFLYKDIHKKLEEESSDLGGLFSKGNF